MTVNMVYPSNISKEKNQGVLIRGPEWLEFIAQAEVQESSSTSSCDDSSSVCSTLTSFTCFNTTNIKALGESVLHVLGVDEAMKNLQDENDIRYHEQQQESAMASNQRAQRRRSSFASTSNVHAPNGRQSSKYHEAVAEDFLLQNKKALSTLRSTLQDKDKFKKFTQEVKAHLLCAQTKTRLHEIVNDDEEFRRFQHLLRQTKMTTAHAATHCVFASSIEDLSL